MLLASIGRITSPATSTTTTVHDGPETNPVPDFVPVAKTRQRLSFKPPPLPPEDDKSLFRVASLVNSITHPGSPKGLHFYSGITNGEGYPYPTQPLPSLFLTVRPLPFAPLWELYFNQIPKSLFNVYVHADLTHPYETPFSGVFAHRVIRSKPALRFTPTLISAARWLLAHALLHDRSNYMFVLLSASCIPIQSFNFTNRTLIRSKKSFIEILDNEIGTFDRWAKRGPRRDAAGDHLGQVQSTVWEWDNCYPEENYLPTLVHVHDPIGVVPATLTHVDWNGSSDGHPRMGSDSSVIRRRDPFLLARKFASDSIQQLMRIASEVIFSD
ncbi:Detected protein of unknown function [Hibiscus syriacus]|uniref:Uncharacterized protein n=1 Tax=Hibiscus syriacus TaxID=106335 RepID=A0A6A3CUM0_HIBSY|nr:Detected protein of unknown function [Hibiscus syriacus]